MKNTKFSLSLSIISIVVCVILLIGTTFAWFTDQSISSVNKIVAGNLDIKFEYSSDATNWNEVTPTTTDIFGTNNLWEPGYAQIAYFRISNAGNLALKYSLIVDQYEETEGINQNGDPFLLSDYLQIGTIDNRTTPFDSTQRAVAAAAAESMKPMSEYQKTGSLQPTQTTSMAMLVYMPETIGNEANHDGIHIPDIKFRLNLYATQHSSESDSFGNSYDLGAQIPSLPKIVVKNIQAVSKTVEEIKLKFPENAPEVGNTEITFPPGSFTQEGANLNLFAETKNQTAANPSFAIDNAGTGTIAGIKLNATLGEDAISTFNGQHVTITTYIEKNLDSSNIKLYYVTSTGSRIEASESGGDFEIISYEPATGKFIFKTNHFSQFEIIAPLVEKVTENLYNIKTLRGLYVMANDTTNQNTYRLMDKDGIDLFDFTARGYAEDVQKLSAQGLKLEVKGNVTLDTNHFRINLFDAPLTVASGGRLTLSGSLGGANINTGTFNSLKTSKGTIKVQAGNFIACDPAKLDSSLTENHSDYIAVSYNKDSKQQFAVGQRSKTFVYGAPNTVYTPVHDNYTITTLADNRLYSVYTSVRDLNIPGTATVYLLPGHYKAGTTVSVFSSINTVGLGDKENIIVEKTSSSGSNRHFFNLSNRDSVGYDNITLRNLKLVVSANNMNGTTAQDNAAVQVIGWTKAKLYDLIIDKTTSQYSTIGRTPFYVNGNNTAVDGNKYRVYAYYENVVCVASTSSLFDVASSYTIRSHNLKYDNGSKTFTSYTRGFLDYNNWDW